MKIGSLFRQGRPARKSGFAMRYQGGDLVIWSPYKSQNWVLNSSAATVWMFCDGQMTVGEIEEWLVELMPEQAVQIVEDLPEILNDLRRQGLLGSARYGSTSRPLLRVGFSNFWSAFDDEDNYFLWMLSYRSDVLLVNPDREEPDVLFYSSFPLPDFGHVPSAGKAARIHVSIDEPADAVSDFAFCLRQQEIVPDPGPTGRHEEKTERTVTLPIWFTYLNWEHYDRAAPSFGSNGLPQEYHPERVCHRLWRELFGKASSAHSASLRRPPTFSPSGVESTSVLEAGSREFAPRETGWFAKESFSGQSDRKRERIQAENKGHQVAAHENRAGVQNPSAGKRLTIGMATFDDYDGVYFSSMALRLYHPEVTGQTTIIVIDNNPDGPCGEALRSLSDWIEDYHYVPSREIQGTASRDLVFREATTDYVLCMDSHVMLAPGSVKMLIDYLDGLPGSLDLLQGPLVYDDLKRIATHFKPMWSHGMFGVWRTDDRGASPDYDPFEIPMQGLGVFACRKEAWPGFNPRFRGFGGEEGYIHEKFRQMGGRTLCLPFLRWTHRFNRPMGTQYSVSWVDRIHNYYVGFSELGLDPSQIERHYRDHLGVHAFERIYAEVSAELANPFSYFDAIYCINMDHDVGRWEAIQVRFSRLGILHRVRRFAGIQTPDSHHVGCALSHRRIVERAKQLGLRNVLVFEDDAIFLEDTLIHLQKSLDELMSQDWSILLLGGCKWGHELPKASGCEFLEIDNGIATCTHAIAYDESIFSKILDDLPSDRDGMVEWTQNHTAIDQYLLKLCPRHVAAPVVASQPPILPFEATGYRDRFTL